jgi:tetratricopeptide (TPR) repeat protein
LLEAIGESWLGLGENSKSVDALQRAEALFAQSLGADHRRTLVARRKLALSLSKSGRRTQGIEVHEQLLKKLIQKYGHDDPDTLIAMDSLGLAYQIDGKSQKAIPLHEQTLKLNEKNHGWDGSETLRSMDLLGGAYVGVGRIDEAVELHKKTIAIKQAKLGADNLSTLESMENLALAYRSDRRLRNAIPIYEYVVSQLKKKLGERHSDTLFTMNRLGLAYWLAGLAEKAVEVHEHVLGARIEKWGSKNADTLVSKSNLASAYADAGRIDDAIRLHEETFAIRKNWGADVRKFNTMHGLAYSYYLNGRYGDAADYALQAYNGRREQRGPAHMETLTSLHNVLCSFQAAGELAGAAEAAYLEYAAYMAALELASKKNLPIVKAATVIDNVERAAPDYPSMLAAWELLPTDEQHAEAAIRSVVDRGEVSDFMYLVLARCFAAAGKQREARETFITVLADQLQQDGEYDLAGADFNERLAAYFLDLLAEEQLVSEGAEHPSDTEVLWFYIGQRRELEGAVERAQAAYSRCVDRSVGIPHTIGALARWRVDTLTRSSGQPTD